MQHFSSSSGEKPFPEKKNLQLFFILLFVAALYITQQISSAEFYFSRLTGAEQLRVGIFSALNWMHAEFGSGLTTNSIWLPSICLAVIDQVFLEQSPIVFLLLKFSLITLSFYLVFKLFLRLSAAEAFSLGLTLVTGLGLFIEADLNPELFLLFFTICSMTLLQLYQQRPQKIIFTALVFSVWMLARSSAVSLPASLLISIYILSLTIKAGQKFAILVAVCLSFTLAVDGQILSLNLIQAQLRHFELSLEQFLSADWQNPLLSFSFAFFLIQLCLLSLCRVRFNVKLHQTEYLVVSLALGLALIEPRLVGVGMLILGAILARIWPILAGDNPLKIAILKLSQLTEKLSLLGLIWVLLCFSIVHVNALWQKPLFKDRVFEAAVKQLLDLNPTVVILNPKLAGPLLLSAARSGNVQLKISSDFFTIQNDPQMARAFKELTQTGRNWNEISQKTSANAILSLSIEPLAQILKAAPEWQAVTDNDSKLKPERRISWQIFTKR
ncbi:hypothetical protein JNK13_06080 [bacterium]|nr:hypothetical protein [bacterium]